MLDSTLPSNWLERIRAVVFDLDGVLADSVQSISESMRGAFREHGLAPPSDARLRSQIGPPLRRVLDELVLEQGGSPREVAGVLRTYRRIYGKASATGTPLYPGVRDVVRRLSRRYPLGVATTKPIAFAAPILRHHGLESVFAAIEGPSLDPDCRETKRETLARTLKNLSLDSLPRHPPRAVFIGDRASDVEAGRAHGLVTVAVTWGIGDAAELHGSDPHFTVSRSEELATLLGVEPGTDSA